MEYRRNEKKRMDILKRISEFRLLDDTFMTKCFEDNKECTELVLRIIMNKDDLEVIEAGTQYTIKNLQGRSVRLDIEATDSKNRKYNIEIQRTDKGAGVKRARYNSSLLDANVLLTGDDTDRLPETYVIFITEHDVLEENQPIYHVDRYIKETQKAFGDGAHILYVNGQYKDDTPLGLLMQDFACVNPDDMHYKVLADRVRYFKEDKECRENMCKSIEELCDIERKEAMEEVAKRMLADGKYSLEEIVKIAGISSDEVIKLKQKITV